MRSLARLPKAHLHLHLEGAMRPATFAELAGERGEQPSLPGSFRSFDDFVSAYCAAARLVREGPRENLLRLVREVVGDAAADGAVWIEYYRTGKIGSTSYYWFHKKTSPLFTTFMPYTPGRSQRLDLQVYYKSRWYSSDSEYFRLATNSTSRVQLGAPGTSGIRARMRAVYVKGSSGDSLNATTYTAWKFLYFTN